MALHWRDIAHSLHEMTPFVVAANMAPPRLSGTRIIEAVLIALSAGVMSAVGTVYVTTPVLAVKIEHLKSDNDAMRTELKEINMRTIDLMLHKCPGPQH
jgi:hypothetical protein